MTNFFLAKNLHLSKKRLTFVAKKEKRLIEHEDSDKSEVGILSFLVCRRIVKKYLRLWHTCHKKATIN